MSVEERLHKKLKWKNEKEKYACPTRQICFLLSWFCTSETFCVFLLLSCKLFVFLSYYIFSCWYWKINKISNINLGSVGNQFRTVIKVLFFRKQSETGLLVCHQVVEFCSHFQSTLASHFENSYWSLLLFHALQTNHKEWRRHPSLGATQIVTLTIPVKSVKWRVSKSDASSNFFSKILFYILFT